MGAWVTIVVSGIASHVHNLGAYEGVQVTNLIQKGLKFVTTLFWKYRGPLGASLVGLYTCLYS